MVNATCDRCSLVYDESLYSKCPKCNSGMKRPSWERDKEWITKNLYVASTYAYGSETDLLPMVANFYYNQDIDELVRNKIKFKTPEELDSFLEALNIILSKIGWKTKEKYLEEVDKNVIKKNEVDMKIVDLIKKYPSTVISILANFDPSLITDSANLSLTKELIESLNNTMFKTEEGVKLAFKNLVKKLTKQDGKAMDELANLLETSSLLEITSVTRILMSRLMTLEMFDDMIMNEGTFEIKGDNSVQSKLENNMWILNEEWWLVQANKTLKKFIGDEIAKEDERLRPDFVCVSFEGRLIIVDIKRPSHEISKSDIDQVERYKIIAKQYKGDEYRSIQCYVVGKKIPPAAKNIAEERKGIGLLTYTDLTENVKRKYISYLEALKQARKDTSHKS